LTYYTASYEVTQWDGDREKQTTDLLDKHIFQNYSYKDFRNLKIASKLFEPLSITLKYRSALKQFIWLVKKTSDEVKAQFHQILTTAIVPFFGGWH